MNLGRDEPNRNEIDEKKFRRYRNRDQMSIISAPVLPIFSRLFFLGGVGGAFPFVIVILLTPPAHKKGVALVI